MSLATQFAASVILRFSSNEPSESRSLLQPASAARLANAGGFIQQPRSRLELDVISEHCLPLGAG